jgi:hypothetical protein
MAELKESWMREIMDIVESTSLYSDEKEAVHGNDADSQAEVADHASVFAEGGQDIEGLLADTDVLHMSTLGFSSANNLGFDLDSSNIAGLGDPFASEPISTTLRANSLDAEELL